MTNAAFFDLDNTVVRGSSLLPFAWRLVRSGRVSSSEMFRFASMNARFVRTRTESASGRDYVVRRALSLAAGQEVADIQRLCDEIVPAIVRRRLNPVVCAEIRRHQYMGDQTWLVTASPLELAERIAQELGMTGAMGATGTTGTTGATTSTRTAPSPTSDVDLGFSTRELGFPTVELGLSHP